MTLNESMLNKLSRKICGI